MINKKLIDELYQSLDPIYQKRMDLAVKKCVDAKRENKKICVVTGSGPNIHEGVTTLIAELITQGILEGGVITSSAVFAHEMGGTLDKVKRVDAKWLKFGERIVSLPRDEKFELTMMSDAEYKEIDGEIGLDWDLIAQLQKVEGNVIIKAAGNMAYPMGLRTEMAAEEILKLGKSLLNNKYPLEYLAGLGADPKTMIGAGAKKEVPVMVSIPQMVGGGGVGLSVGDSISIHERCKRNADILGKSDIIIESGLALAQEIHDGPFETYMGHGVWAEWQNQRTYSLGNKTLIRFDLDPNLEKAYQQEREKGIVQEAIAQGKPKAKLTGLPFRMEMSGFARHPNSIPLIGDIGKMWPILATRVADELGVKLNFMSYPQETSEGQKMREYIVENVNYLNRKLVDKEMSELV